MGETGLRAAVPQRTAAHSQSLQLTAIVKML